MLGESGARICRYEPGSAMQPHLHGDASLSIVVGGDYLERIGRSERRYASGYIAFCPAGMMHAQQFGGTGARQIIVQPQPDWLAWLSHHLNLDEAPYKHSGQFHQLGSRLVHELTQKDEFSALAREGMILEIVAEFGRFTGTHAPKPPVWLAAARDFIHAHACAPLSMAQIARAAGRHEIHLARQFRRYYGASIGNYLRRLRIEEAATLLAQSREDITPIALRCGFASHSHLCRVFRAQYGVTPSEYRRRHKL
jgi:AraC family transcriptional regulator